MSRRLPISYFWLRGKSSLSNWLVIVHCEGAVHVKREVYTRGNMQLGGHLVRASEGRLLEEGNLHGQQLDLVFEDVNKHLQLATEGLRFEFLTHKTCGINKDRCLDFLRH